MLFQLNYVESIYISSPTFTSLEKDFVGRHQEFLNMYV